MTYLNLETNEYPRFEGDIRLIHPEIGDEFICPPCFVFVEDGDIPPVTKYQYLSEGFPIKENDVWKRNWQIVEMTDEQKLMMDTIPKSEANTNITWDREKQEWVVSDVTNNLQ